MEIIIKKSDRKNKKYMAIIHDNPTIHKIHFGQKGASDYTIHKDKERMKNYIARHRPNTKEFWKHNKHNLLAPAYWSRWLTWNKPNIRRAANNIEQKNKYVSRIHFR